jgi:hypothetical protein
MSCNMLSPTIEVQASHIGPDLGFGNAKGARRKKRSERGDEDSGQVTYGPTLSASGDFPRGRCRVRGRPGPPISTGTTRVRVRLSFSLLIKPNRRDASASLESACSRPLGDRRQPCSARRFASASQTPGLTAARARHVVRYAKDVSFPFPRNAPLILRPCGERPPSGRQDEHLLRASSACV